MFGTGKMIAEISGVGILISMYPTIMFRVSFCQSIYPVTELEILLTGTSPRFVFVVWYCFILNTSSLAFFYRTILYNHREIGLL